MYFALLLVFGAAFSSGEQCTSPNGDKGTCKSLYECDLLRGIVEKSNRTSQDEQFLRKSKCGYEDVIPKVCCPGTNKLSCITPDRKKGQCINIHSCSNLLELLKKVTTTAEVDYIKASICAGPKNYSVCCGPQPDFQKPVHKSCAEKVSALPPDPDDEDCCGVDVAGESKLLATGGNATFIDQYTWLVVIEYVHPTEKNKLMCGGVLISGKYVLTAAHCVIGAILEKGTPKYVRLGEYNTTNSGPDCVDVEAGAMDCTDDMIQAPIEEIIPHPEYDRFDPDKRHDIALIRLKIFAPFTDFIRPICLPKTDYLQSPPANFTFYVAGWGLYYNNETRLFQKSEVKLHVDVPYVVRDQCQAAVRTLRGAENINFGSGHICAGGVAGKDACRGDSGGPLMFQNRRQFEVIGLVGAGANVCGQEGIPGVYTYIYEYLPWIRKNIRI